MQLKHKIKTKRTKTHLFKDIFILKIERSIFTLIGNEILNIFH